MKKLIVALLAVMMLCVLAVPVMAASDEEYTAARALYEFGLFLGTGRYDNNGNPDFSLDRVPTRNEAVTMLVRLLGKEDEAKAGSWETPFTDVDEWAAPYIGYAYENGLTVGTGDTTFGGGDYITASQYLTFVLRSLGYTNGVDFQWDKAWLLSDQLGITDGQYGADSEFTRGDVAVISECALTVPRKGEQKPDLPAGLSGLAYEINADGTTCTVTGIGNYTDAQVVIPETIDGCTVTAIGEKAFLNCTAITSIEIPETVTSIGTRAFYGCTGITEMTIPASVTDIGLQIFYKASNLHTVYYHSAYSDENNSFLSSTASVEKVVFGGSTVPDDILYARTPVVSIRAVEISDSVTSIGENAFRACNGLTSLTIPDSITSIGDAAFDDCTNLENITISAGVKKIGDSLFSFCRSLEHVTISDGITEIGNSAFFACDNLKSITIPDSVTSIGNSAFYSCSSLESITIPDGVTSIGYSAFWGCNFTSIVIPDSVTKLGSGAFTNCRKLSNVTLGSGLTEINGLFNYCLALESITIPDTVTRIGDETFLDCSNLKNVTLPNNLTYIGDDAFMNCSSLESITIPDGVTSIGERAFCNCSALKRITIPGSVNTFDWYAFLRCSNLETIHFNGTMAQWKAIEKEFGWDNGTGSYTVFCTDGNLVKE